MMTASGAAALQVKRALLSCYNKDGLDAFAKELSALGVELIASGGTAEFLRKSGLHPRSVEDFAGITEQLDGRVKTLHPSIHAGILARRDKPSHVTAVSRNRLIDLVVVNLYPFQETASKPGATLDEVIEQIDIGGVALMRAAAKNCAFVVVASRPEHYREIAEALRAGGVPPAMARRMAVEAFSLTSAYDTAIAGYLGADAAAASPAETQTLALRERQPLRYGENPHQPGFWYVPAQGAPSGLGTLAQLQGKELSYNNLLDLDAALRCLAEFEAPTCAIIKHNSLCGLACAGDVHQAYDQAYACDTESAFGGIVGCNRPIDAALARSLTSTFLEVVAAPALDKAALEILKKKPNLRVVTVAWPPRDASPVEWRQLLGTWLLQQRDDLTIDPKELRVATKRAPTDAEQRSLRFAWAAAKHVKSNAIVLASGERTVGIGQGQPSRVGSVRLAIQKAGEQSRGAVAASDGFFPFPDSVEQLAAAGVTAVIQPGGSIKDEAVIAAADAKGLAMWLTGVRHFRH
jgi:phosphoribosylaminoimidazolecarboxamide formyltransferase/IMP cyclohydrolase